MAPNASKPGAQFAACFRVRRRLAGLVDQLAIDQFESLTGENIQFADPVKIAARKPDAAGLIDVSRHGHL
jgi:hypothetical protein